MNYSSAGLRVVLLRAHKHYQLCGLILCVCVHDIFFVLIIYLRAIVYAISRKARFIGGGGDQREEEYNKLLNIFL